MSAEENDTTVQLVTRLPERVLEPGSSRVTESRVTIASFPRGFFDPRGTPSSGNCLQRRLPRQDSRCICNQVTDFALNAFYDCDVEF
ncbi:hypothetical protein CEXT_66801 [Caerostris extrusa]|uniref:Uncharacterized protein n=1 Tax=Caerostris extrusa TaxID=172846 RepID=A0AAV4MDR0_CAEEX|nr:hypothetical protein CEXT_66801 [Caerostris extrusa]